MRVGARARVLPLPHLQEGDEGACRHRLRKGNLVLHFLFRFDSKLYRFDSNKVSFIFHFLEYKFDRFLRIVNQNEKTTVP